MSGAGEVRQFRHDGSDWLAWVAGAGAYGTGVLGPGLLEAVHFASAVAPDTPLREALLARGRFSGLYDAELAELLTAATPIVTSDQRPR
jgi:hypothetical protein